MATTRGMVIVTGAGSGIGYGTARRLVADGYQVAALDRSEGNLVGFGNPNLTFHAVDVRQKADVERVVQASGTAGIAGLVVCAAIFKTVPFLDLDEATWDDHFDVNLKGCLFCCQAVLPFMRKQQRGSIVLFSSMAARTGFVRGSHYAATKGGILGFARSLALEVAQENIRVNVVSPGITDTPQPRGNTSVEEIYSRAKDIPLGRIGQPDDMVEATMFLLEDDSSFVTGQDIRVNGGGRLF